MTSMKILLAALALALAGASQAAPTTFYFSGTADLHQVVDRSTGAWVASAAAQRFSGSITVDGRNGTPQSVLGYPADIQSMQLSTNSRCAVVYSGECTSEPGVPTNFLGFTLNLGGTAYNSWATGTANGTEFSNVTKVRSTTGSGYTVSGGIGVNEVLGTSPGGALYRVLSGVGLGVTLAGGPLAVGDVYDPGQFPDLSSFVPSLSELHFNSSSFTCTEVDGGCQDVVFAPDSVVMIGRLDYVGLAPEAASEVPEPASAALLLAGGFGMLAVRRCARRRAGTHKG